MNYDKMPILFDVDGVVTTGFFDTCASRINERFDTKYKASDFYTDLRKVMPEWDSIMESEVRAEGFCLKFKPDPDAQDVIANLIRDNYNVKFVTSPYYRSKSWADDRIEWLEDNFKVTRDEVILCHEKRYVAGELLVEDLVKHAVNWSNFNKKPSLVFERPWNTQDIEKLQHDGYAPFYVVRDWEKIDRIIRRRVW